MKFSTASTVALTLSSLWGDAIAFAPAAKLHAGAKSSGRRAGARFMAMDMDMPATVQDAPAPATRAAESLPVIQSRGGAPGGLNASDRRRCSSGSSYPLNEPAPAGARGSEMRDAASMVKFAASGTPASAYARASVGRFPKPAASAGRPKAREMSSSARRLKTSGFFMITSV